MIYFYIFISIFVLLAFIHLYFCFTEQEKYRRLTKPFVIAFLAISLVFISPDNFPYVYIALFLGAVGDFLLIEEKKNFYFSLGIIFFAAEHILITYSIISLTSLLYVVPFYVYIIIDIVVAAAGFVGYKKAKGDKKIVGLLSLPYALLLLTNFLFSISLIVSKEYLLGILLLFGYLIFIFSDYLVNYSVNIKIFKRQHFFIMLTYIVAQCAIGISLVFCAINLI